MVTLIEIGVYTGRKNVVRLERRTTEDNSSRRITRPVPVFTLETNNQTNNERLPKFFLTDIVSSSIKTANMMQTYVSSRADLRQYLH